MRASKTEITIVEEKTLKSRDMIDAFKMLKRMVKANIDKLAKNNDKHWNLGTHSKNEQWIEGHYFFVVQETLTYSVHS